MVSGADYRRASGSLTEKHEINDVSADIQLAGEDARRAHVPPRAFPASDLMQCAEFAPVLRWQRRKTIAGSRLGWNLVMGNVTFYSGAYDAMLHH